MGEKQGLLIAVIVLIALFLIIFTILFLISKVSNFYPNATFRVEITNKRSMDDDDLFDFYIINYGTERIDAHLLAIKEWKEEIINSYNGNQKKIDSFEERCTRNQCKAFHFVGFRAQTRYKQVNYKKSGYIVEVVTNDFSTNEKYVTSRIDFLKQHDYNVTFNQYTNQDQRKAMTAVLRSKIKVRDNYTCQICGKVMNDEVGLQIDHIVPIAKGGKSIPSNLRVLCSKCNGSKGDK